MVWHICHEGNCCSATLPEELDGIGTPGVRIMIIFQHDIE
jgi:hypothetical protein